MTCPDAASTTKSRPTAPGRPQPTTPRQCRHRPAAPCKRTTACAPNDPWFRCSTPSSRTQGLRPSTSEPYAGTRRHRLGGVSVWGVSPSALPHRRRHRRSSTVWGRTSTRHRAKPRQRRDQRPGTGDSRPTGGRPGCPERHTSLETSLRSAPALPWAAESPPLRTVLHVKPAAGSAANPRTCRSIGRPHGRSCRRLSRRARRCPAIAGLDRPFEGQALSPSVSMRAAPGATRPLTCISVLRAERRRGRAAIALFDGVGHVPRRDARTGGDRPPHLLGAAGDLHF